MIQADQVTFPIPHLVDAVHLTLHIGSQSYGFRVQTKRIMDVLEGKDGWLFLANDTNQSIAQFRGQSLMTENVQADWRNFLQEAGQIPESILFVPPSKESVFPEFYPYEMAAMRPIDQLKELVRQTLFPRYLYPRDLLRTSRETYSKTETHYTTFGAMLCFEELIRRYLDVSLEAVQDKHFEFEERNNIGDLGSKLRPIQSSAFLFLKDPHTKEHSVYENGLQSTGRVGYFRNAADALSNKKVLIFGDSFAGFLLPFFHACFRDVLYCRTVGTIHMDVVEKYQPDYILSELTERFILRAPSIWRGKEAAEHRLQYDESIFS